MENRCRLCANVKTPRQLICSIEDQSLNIEQKLIDCCRWKSYENYSTYSLPQKICNACMRNLEKSWTFAESVTQAQQTLLTQIVDIKPTVLLQIESVDPNISTNLEEMVTIEEIKLSISPLHFCYDDDNFDESLMIEKNEFKLNDDGKSNVDEIRTNAKIPTVRDSINNNFLGFLSNGDKMANGIINAEKVLDLNLDDWSMIKWRCYICSGIFGEHCQLKRHFDQNHQYSTFRYLCWYCDTSFRQRPSVARHIIHRHRPYLKHWFVFQFTAVNRIH